MQIIFGNALFTKAKAVAFHFTEKNIFPYVLTIFVP